MKSVKSLKYNHLFANVFSWPIRWRRTIQAVLSAKNRERENLIFSRISDTLVSDLVIRPPNIDGEFYISPKSHLLRSILSRGAYEPEIVTLFEKHLSSGKDVVDIGANIGFYTILSAKRMKGGRVLALEPVKSAYDRLLQNIERNGVERVASAVRCFVSNEKGVEVIRSVPGMEEYSSASESNIRAHARDQTISTEQVDCVTLDDIVSEQKLNPGLIKIDVEGAEYKVLLGAKRCLEEFCPTLIIECSDNLLKGMGASSMEIILYLENLGYRPLDPHTEGEVSLRKGIEDNLLFVKT